MTSATVTTKGQVTIPKQIRDHLNLGVGSKVDFVITEDGTVKVIPLTVPIKTLSGMLHRPNLPTATIEDMEAAIAQGACDWT